MVLTVVLLVVPRLAVAEDFTSYKLQLQTNPKFPNGKIRAIEGTADQLGDHFFLEGVGVLQPLAITLVAQHQGDEIEIAFGQDRWDEKIETAKTGPEGEITTKLRTQGDLKMTITASGEPKPYWLFVWVGDEVKPDLASVVTPLKTYKAKHPNGPPPPPGAKSAGGTSPVMYVIAGALVVIVVLLLLLVVRKRGRS